MSDVQPKLTIKQILIGVGAVLFIILLAIVVRPEPDAPESIAVGRYQIVSEPSGVVMRIDTDNGVTDRLVRDEPTGIYTWERIQ